MKGGTRPLVVKFADSKRAQGKQHADYEPPMHPNPHQHSLPPQLPSAPPTSLTGGNIWYNVPNTPTRGPYYIEQGVPTSIGATANSYRYPMYTDPTPHINPVTNNVRPFDILQSIPYSANIYINFYEIQTYNIGYHPLDASRYNVPIQGPNDPGLTVKETIINTFFEQILL